MEHRLASGELQLAIEIPAGFGRDLRRGRAPEVAVWIDGAMPFHAESVRGYVQGVHAQFLTDLAAVSTTGQASQLAAIEIRFRYNQDFDSVKAMVPATMSMLLALIPAILMALAVVREKELGSITNLYVTPVRRIEFILGKQLPYVGLAMVDFARARHDGGAHLRRAVEGQPGGAGGRGADLCLGDDSLRAVDLELRQHADRGLVRHRDPDGAAGDAVLRHAGSGIDARRAFRC